MVIVRSLQKIKDHFPTIKLILVSSVEIVKTVNLQTVRLRLFYCWKQFMELTARFNLHNEISYRIYFV